MHAAAGREPHRPLFVSVLLYLNSAWDEEYHAETLFMDPEAQLGLFVRPVPGRCAAARGGARALARVCVRRLCVCVASWMGQGCGNWWQVAGGRRRAE